MAGQRTGRPRALKLPVIRDLARNAALSGTVFAVSGVIALALVPILVGAYGLYAFGLLMLVRALLPTGVLAALDLGVSEVATQAIARAQVNGNWDEAAARLRALLMIAVAVALVGALGVFALGTWIEFWMDVQDDYKWSFVSLIQMTGGALLLLFPALVAEGVLKGFEAYRWLRAAEIVSTMLYAGAAVLAVRRGFAYDAVGYAFLASIILRFAALSALALALLRQRGALRWLPTNGHWGPTMKLCWLMMRGKFLGVLQSQAPPVLIGALIGAVAVGVYDIIMRLPRFAKSVLGLLNALVMPLATRLDEKEDAAGQRRLGSVGMLLVPAIAVPPLAVGALLSEPLMRYWMGAEFASLWSWQAVAFTIPLASAIIGSGSVALLAKQDAARRLLRFTALQVAAQYIVALALVNWLDERSFILGQALATVLLFAPQLMLVRDVQGIPPQYVGRVCVFLSTTAAATAAGSIVVAASGLNWFATLVAASVAVVGLAVMAWWMLFDLSQRVRIVTAMQDFVLRRGHRPE